MSQEKKEHNKQSKHLEQVCGKRKNQRGEWPNCCHCFKHSHCEFYSSPIAEENSFNRTLTKEEITDLYNKGVAVEKEGWEERFDEKFSFLNDCAIPAGGSSYAMTSVDAVPELKSFISQTLAEEREKYETKIKQLENEVEDLCDEVQWLTE